MNVVRQFTITITFYIFLVFIRRGLLFIQFKIRYLIKVKSTFHQCLNDEAIKIKLKIMDEIFIFCVNNRRKKLFRLHIQDSIIISELNKNEPVDFLHF